MDTHVVVVTGSSRGFGLALARAFLARGCAVVVCGRNEDSVAEAVASLREHAAAERILGRRCDMGRFDDVQALWDGAVACHGRVDTWINNAGQGVRMRPFWEQPADSLESVVDANLLGSYYGCRVALAGMLAQGFGSVWNMEGFGSDGGVRPGLTPYAATKAAIRALTKGLAAETNGTLVHVGAISPGMLATELLLGNVAPEQAQSARRIFNILADRVETVAPWVADRVLASRRNGERIVWLTKNKIYRRFLTAPFHRRHVIDA